MGVRTREEDGWIRNQGLRIIGGGMRLELPWPELATFPATAWSAPRLDFDQMLADHARASGAKLLELHHGHRAGARRAHRPRRRRRAHPVDDRGRRAGEDVTYRAPLVVAADGVSGRLALGARHRAARRPPDGRRGPHLLPQPAARRRLAGDLARALGRRARAVTPAARLRLDLRRRRRHQQRRPRHPQPPTAFGKVDYKELLRRWSRRCPPEWEYSDETQVGPIRGAALPMGFNRTPHYTRGLLLVGDSGGMVNPFNGEGIAYAMESGRSPPRSIAQALSRPDRRRARARARRPTRRR